MKYSKRFQLVRQNKPLKFQLRLLPGRLLKFKPLQWKRLGWKIGDTLQWRIDDESIYVFRKQTEREFRIQRLRERLMR